MATANWGIDLPFQAASGLSGNQYYAVKLNETSGAIELSNATSRTLGILQDKPAAASRACAVRVIGASKAVASGTIGYMDALAADDSGHLVATTTDNDETVALALETHTGATSSVIKVFVVPMQRY